VFPCFSISISRLPPGCFDSSVLVHSLLAVFSNCLETIVQQTHVAAMGCLAMIRIDESFLKISVILSVGTRVAGDATLSRDVVDAFPCRVHS